MSRKAEYPSRLTATGGYQYLVNGTWLSRQRVWQMRRIADGKCHTCGKARDGLATHCRACATKTYARHKKGTES